MEDCAGRPGTAASLSKPLGQITCPVATIASNCPVQFPVPVITKITNTGSTATYEQVAFLFVVLRGFGKVAADQLQFDLEFLHVQLDGEIGLNPTPGTSTIKGSRLCAVDHDPIDVATRCIPT